jgi:hypothetical protein
MEVVSRELVTVSDIVQIEDEMMTDREAINLIVLVIKKLCPYVGFQEVAFRHLDVFWYDSECQFNGYAKPYRPEGRQGLAARIVLNSRFLLTRTTLLSTLLHELAHVLVIRPMSLLPLTNCPLNGHTVVFQEQNILLIKLAKMIPEIRNAFDLYHPALNVFSSVSYRIIE